MKWWWAATVSCDGTKITAVVYNYNIWRSVGNRLPQMLHATPKPTVLPRENAMGHAARRGLITAVLAL